MTKPEPQQQQQQRSRCGDRHRNDQDQPINIIDATAVAGSQDCSAVNTPAVPTSVTVVTMASVRLLFQGAVMELTLLRILS